MISCVPVKETITIGTFNIYWFFEIGMETNFLSPARDLTDFKTIATLIHDLNADLLVLQEVTAEKALVDIVETLNKEFPQDRWSYKDANGEVLRGRNHDGSISNHQEVAIIYKEDRVVITGKKHMFNVMPDPDNDGRREPLMVHVKVKNGDQSTDFDLIGVHLKSLGGNEWKEVKEAEFAHLINWFQNSWINHKETADHSTWNRGVFDPDMVIIGDFNAALFDQGNDRAKASFKMIRSFAEKTGFHAPKFPEDSLGYIDTYFFKPYENVIDLMFFSNDFYQIASQTVYVDTFDLRVDYSDFPDTKRMSRSQGKLVPINKLIRISDHRPVTIQIKSVDIE